MSSSQEIARAFKFWTDAANLQIDETSDTPDIAISSKVGPMVMDHPLTEEVNSFTMNYRHY